MTSGLRRMAKVVAGSASEFLRTGAPPRQQRLRALYLDLMEGCLTGTIYEDAPLRALGQEHYDAELREYGWDWPSVAPTMIGSKRLSNLRSLTESVIQRRIPGDLMETGVWRGGACIMMRAILQAYDLRSRRVWLVDSFEGVPAPDPEHYPADAGATFHEFPDLVVGLDEVKSNFERFGLLDDQVVFLKGWFRDTLPSADVDRLALLRLDGDLYESTIIPLEALYDKVSRGGFVIVDDFHVVDGCRTAVEDFFESRSISPSVEEIDGVGIYWRKE